MKELDKNLVVDQKIDKRGIVFHNFEKAPFKSYGGIKKEADGLIYRMPREVAEKINNGVLGLCTNTAGGRVRFRSNSKKIAIMAKYESIIKRPHMAMTGIAGMDLFSNDIFLGCFVPPTEMPNNAYESVIYIPGEKLERDLTINLPLYANLTELYIGIEEGATLSEPSPYKSEKPIVYYGSSITQGACASRPGASYQSHISRWFDCDYINLGFSGSAHGEERMADYISTLDMRAFVCDYDYNASSPEYLETTHLAFYRRIRAAHSDIPIIFMTRPNGLVESDRLRRRGIIKRTYETAILEGDKNVYFLDPTEHMPFYANEGMVEGVHPSDLGFYFIAKALQTILKDMII